MKQNESGRSMIEMLGVLAIIGVLSIGGLAGYTMAMNRWRSSDISDYVSRCVVVAQTKSITGRIAAGDTDCATVLGEDVPGWLIGSNKKVTLAENTANGQITATVADIPSAVDRVLTDRFGDAVIGGVRYSNQVFTYVGSAVS